MYGEEILNRNRLNPNSNLSNPESDGYILILNTIGYYLDKINGEDTVEQLFLATATGRFLDLHGAVKGVYRKQGETDEEYRSRIIQISNFVLSIECLEEIGAEIFCYVEELNNQITSDNPLLSRRYLIYAEDEIKEIIDKYINNWVYEYLEELDV